MYKKSRFKKSNTNTTSNPYFIFNPHSIQPCVASQDKLIYITTIDPGIKNCAIRCSQYNPLTFKSKTILLCKVNFVHNDLLNCNTPGSQGLETFYYCSIFNTLDQYKYYFILSHYIAIESQYYDNPPLLRMAQHIITYLMCNVRNQGHRPYIVELKSQLKTQMLGAPPKMDKPQRKKWAVQAALYYLGYNNEPEMVEFISKQNKDDDFGDVVCYEQVMIKLIFNNIHQLPYPTLLKL